MPIPARVIPGAEDAAGARAFTIISGRAVDGWAYGLAAGGLAADVGAPLLLVTSDAVPEATASLVGSCGAPAVDLLVVGGDAIVSDAVVTELDALDGHACP